MSRKPRNMRPEPEAGMFDRLGFVLVGGLTGAAYGGLLTLLVYLATGTAQLRIVGWSAVVFAGLGYGFGNFIVAALLSLVHFLWGLGCALADRPPPPPADGPRNYLGNILLLGFGTGLVLLLWVWV